jgi:ferrochelatase
LTTAGGTAVLLCNLGTPDAPSAPAVRRFLAEFLGDARVVEIPRLVWWPLLHGVILRLRPARSAAKYAAVWTAAGSPLRVWTERQAEGLGRRLQDAGHQVTVRHAMRYGGPSIAAVLDELRAAGTARVLVLPLYPQYSCTTTASIVDAVGAWTRRTRVLPELRFVRSYEDEGGYVAALAGRLSEHWREHGRPDRLVMSFHGVPQRTVDLGDPYETQCRRTAALLAARLGLDPAAWTLTFQSRFGRAKWLEPATEPTVRLLAAQGAKRIDVICPGFVADCLETLEEISLEVRDAFLGAGGERFDYVACLNDGEDWIGALAALAERHLQGWPTRP